MKELAGIQADLAKITVTVLMGSKISAEVLQMEGEEEGVTLSLG